MNEIESTKEKQIKKEIEIEKEASFAKAAAKARTEGPGLSTFSRMNPKNIGLGNRI